MDEERKRNNMKYKFGIWKYPRLYFANFGLVHVANQVNQAIFYKLASFFNHLKFFCSAFLFLHRRRHSLSTPHVSLIKLPAYDSGWRQRSITFPVNQSLGSNASPCSVKEPALLISPCGNRTSAIKSKRKTIPKLL